MIIALLSFIVPSSNTLGFESLLDLVALGLAVTGYTATRRYGGSIALAAVALGVSGLGLLIAVGQAMFGYILLNLGP